MTETLPMVEKRPTIAPLPVIDSGEFAELLDTNRFAQIQRVAALFAESDLVPAVFQGKPANCAVALQMAFRMRVDPMMLMQNMYIVAGRPGIEAKLAIALINSRGPFKGPLQWRFDGTGDDRTCYCYAIHRATDQKCEAAVPWRMVVAEGWLSKSGSKWKTMPEIMFQYRSAMFLGRLYCPEVLLGLPTNDELHDIEVEVEGTTILRRQPGAAIKMPQPIDKAVAAIDKAMEIGREMGKTIDAATGEITGAPGPVETGAPPAQEAAGDAGTPTEAQTPAEPAAAAQAPATPAEVMQRPASEAQRKAIEATGKRLGLSPSEIDEIVADATTFSLANLPQGAVNAALGALAARGKK